MGIGFTFFSGLLVVLSGFHFRGSLFGLSAVELRFSTQIRRQSDGVDSNHSVQPSFVSKTDRNFPRVLGGFLTERLPSHENGRYIGVLLGCFG